MTKWTTVFVLVVFCLGFMISVSSGKELRLEDIFPADRILDVQISVAEEDWDTIRHQSRDFYTSLSEARRLEPVAHPYTYVDASVKIDGVTYPRVGLRKKGFIGSESAVRPSLKIKLNHVDKAGGIDGLTNLTLNNNKQDVHLVSQYLGYGLFNAAGLPAPRCAYAKVSVNGVNLGIYSHVETMREPLLMRVFGNSDGSLYEGTVVDFYEGWDMSFEHKRGGDARGRAKINALIEVLAGGEVTEAAIGELVDLDSFYRFWAMEGLLGFWDGYSGNNNNFFMYLNPVTDKFHFVPWGMDSAFTEFSELKFMNDSRAPISVKTQGLIAYKLYQLESGRERYAGAMAELLEKYWDEGFLLAELDRISALVTPHLTLSQRYPEQEKEERWRKGSSVYEDALDETREFIRGRRASVVKEMSGGMPVWTKRPNPPFVLDKEGNFKKMFAGALEGTLMDAVGSGDLEAINRHVAEGADVNENNQQLEMAPLAWASLTGQRDSVALLLEHGADINGRSRGDGATALHIAVFLGRVDIVSVLLKAGADVTVKNDAGHTPTGGLWAPWEMTEFIVKLFGLGLKREEIEAGRAEIAELLSVEGLPSVESKEARAWEAVYTGDFKTVKAALAAGFDVNARDEQFGVTLLSSAALMGHTSIVTLLLEHGADVNAKNGDGGTALHNAAFLGRAESVKVLLAHGADVTARNRDGATAMEAATLDWGITKFIVGMLKIEVDREEVEAGRAKVVFLLSGDGE